MAQIRESCFRVTDEQDIDYDLVDLHSGLPVIVERNHREYSSSLDSQIDSLEVGNLVCAELQSEDVLQADGIWRFLQIDIFDESKVAYVEDAELPDEHAQRIGYNITTQGGEYMEYTPEGYDDLSVVLIGKNYSDEQWNLLKLDPYRELYSWFTESPPYEVVHQKIPEHDFLLSYHISSTNTDFAEQLKDGQLTQ